MTHELNGKWAIVTGASAGIGQATAWALAALGMKLIVTARREAALQTLCAEIKQNGGEARAYALDVRERAGVAAFGTWVREQGITPYALINNAGLARGLSPIQEGSLDDWDEMIDTNIKGLLYMTRAFLPMMIAQNAGHIVNIGSIAGLISYPKGNVYCATKAAVKALNESINIDLLGTDIRCTLIEPGMVKTEFSEVRFHGDKDRADCVYTGVDYLGAEHIANAIVYAVGAPQPVNVQTLTIVPTAQRNAYVLSRK